MGNELRNKLAVLAVAVGELRHASMLEKIEKADLVIALQVDLLGALVDKIVSLERDIASLDSEVKG